MKRKIFVILICALFIITGYGEMTSSGSAIEISTPPEPKMCNSSKGKMICFPLILKNFVIGFNFPFDNFVAAWHPHPEGADWKFEGGNYTATGIPGAWVSTSYPTIYTDFDFQAKLRRSGCPGCPFGLIVRGEPNPLGAGNRWDSGYGFYITQSGYYGIFKYVDGKATTIQDWETSSEIKQGEVAWNSLHIKAIGENLEFYINNSANLYPSGSVVAYPSGKVGIIMFTKSDSIGDQLWVDWAKLTPLPP